MKFDRDVITREEMIELTGYKYPSKQCNALKKAGIFFIVRSDGYPVTTWQHVNQPNLKKDSEINTDHYQPNFGALDG